MSLRGSPLRAVPFVLAAGLCASATGAQQKPAVPVDEATVDAEIAKALTGFARTAEGQKCFSRARAVYQEILDHYDADSNAAHNALGWKKVKGEWVLPDDPKLPPDAATAPQRRTVDAAWRALAQKLATKHRELGLAMQRNGDLGRATVQFERALRFDPDDAAVHDALGHATFEGFRGTAEEIAFVQRMRAILAKAEELRALAVETHEVPASSMPKELLATGIPLFGARSANFTCWSVDSVEVAADFVTWNERALQLLRFLLENHPKRLVDPSAVKWIVVLRSAEQRDVLLRTCPAALAEYTPENAQRFGSLMFRLGTSWAEWATPLPEDHADKAVAHVTKRCLANRARTLGEGLVHAATWLLCGSVKSYYFNLPTTVAGNWQPLPNDPTAWLDRIREQVEAGDDWPLQQIPRERLDNFRESARIKSWSFVLWLIARHPNAWMRLIDALAKDQASPEDVETAFQSVLGRSVGDAQEEWRRWVRQGSRIGAASGLPQD